MARSRAALLTISLLLAASVLGWLVVPWRAIYCYRQVPQAIAQRRFAEALALLEPCLQAWPQDRELVLRAAQAAQQAGNFERSGQLLDRYRDLGGDPEVHRRELCILLLARGPSSLIAESTLQEQLRGGGDSLPRADRIRMLQVLAGSYSDSKRLAPALETLAQLLELEGEPPNPRTLLLRAAVEERVGMIEQAVADYRRVVEVEPNNEEARLRLAWFLKDVFNETVEATELFEGLAKDRPNDPEVLMGLASCRFAQGDSAGAGHLARQVLAAYPSSPTALRMLAKLSLASGQFAEAEAALAQAAAAPFPEPETLADYVQCLQLLRKKREADQVRRRLERQQEAAKELQAILENPQQIQAPDPGIRLRLGELYIRSGNSSEGLKWISGVLREQPTLPQARELLKEFEAQSGRFAPLPPDAPPTAAPKKEP